MEMRCKQEKRDTKRKLPTPTQQTNVLYDYRGHVMDILSIESNHVEMIPTLLFPPCTILYYS